MSELDGNLLVLGVGEVDNLLQPCDMTVAPETNVFWSDSAFWKDCGSFYKGKPWSATDNTSNCDVGGVLEDARYGL